MSDTNSLFYQIMHQIGRASIMIAGPPGKRKPFMDSGICGVLPGSNSTFRFGFIYPEPINLGSHSDHPISALLYLFHPSFHRSCP